MPERAGARCEYQAIWYLLPNYVRPGLEHAVETVLTVERDLAGLDEERFRAAMAAVRPTGRAPARTSTLPHLPRRLPGGSGTLPQQLRRLPGGSGTLPQQLRRLSEIPESAQQQLQL